MGAALGAVHCLPLLDWVGFRLARTRGDLSISQEHSSVVAHEHVGDTTDAGADACLAATKHHVHAVLDVNVDGLNAHAQGNVGGADWHMRMAALRRLQCNSVATTGSG
jgi:hypothetical protein